MSCYISGRTPFSRTGGKSKLAKKLINKFPKNYEIYVEPFVGAGNIILRKKPQGVEIINDLERDIYIIFKAIQNDPIYINENVQHTLIKDKDEYKCMLKNKDAVSLIRIFKQSFLGRVGHYMNPDLRLKDGRKSDGTIKTDYIPISERLQNVQIYNEPFEKMIEKYDTYETFFYLDPPYESKNKRDYNDYVSPEEIYKNIKNITGKFMLSYNNSENIRNIFKEFYIEEIETKYERGFTKQGPKHIIELIITNYKI